MANNSTTCDPVLTEVIRSSGQPVRQTLTSLLAEEHLLTIYNDAPGLTTLALEVNGHHVQVGRLHDSEVRSVDLAAGLVAGATNTLVVTATGKPGGQATLLLSPTAPASRVGKR